MAKNILIDPKSGLWGKYRLQKKNPNLKLQIEEEFKNNEAFSINQPLRKKFPRRIIAVKKVDLTWVCDLADVSQYKKDNDGTTFLLVCIDILSRYAFVEPLKNKTNKEIIRGYTTIFERSGRKPSRIQTDQGKEFLGKDVLAFFREQHIYHYVVYSDLKAVLAERFNRTLKMLINKYMDTHNTLRYVDVLQDLVYNYNHTIHRTINIAPAEVNQDNQQEIYERLLARQPKVKPPKYQVDDYVKISRSKNLFEKETSGNYTIEIFKIYRVLHTIPIMYKLEDLNGEPINGSFYEPELIKVNKPEQYIIEKVIKTKTVKGKKQYFVKWKGYNDSFNSWVDNISEIEPDRPITESLKPSVESLKMKKKQKGDGITEYFTDNQFLPEMHLPDHSFTGPNTKLIPRLTEMQKYIQGQIQPDQCEFKNCSLPKNAVDAASMFHDMSYHEYKDLEHRHQADQVLLDEVNKVLENTNSLREKLDALFVKGVMGSKLALGI